MTLAAAVANRLRARRRLVLSRRANAPHMINKTNPARPSGLASHRPGALRCGSVAFGPASDPGGSSIPDCLLASVGSDSFVAASGYRYRCGMICFGVEGLLHSRWIADFPRRCNTQRGCPPSRPLLTQRARFESAVRMAGASDRSPTGCSPRASRRRRCTDRTCRLH